MAAEEDELDEELPPSLDDLLETDSLKWIFVGGKGGVGKTTTSCSLAIALAARRESVLLISTDPAHNLSDAFGQQFSKEETPVNGFDNLYAMEIDPKSSIADRTQGIMEDQKTMGLLAELSSSIPGIDEAMSFAELMKRVQQKKHSVIIFDTAPTGHTLRLLSFPTTLETAFEKLSGLKDKFGGLINTFSSMMGGGAGPSSEQLLGKLEATKKIIAQVNKTFQDPDLTTFVCVCIPEFLSLYETERLIQELTKFGIDTNSIVINQVLYPKEFEIPANATGRVLEVMQRHKARVRMQSKYIDQFHDLYPDYYLCKMPLLDQEVRKVEALKRFGHFLSHPFDPEKPVAEQYMGIDVSGACHPDDVD